MSTARNDGRNFRFASPYYAPFRRLRPRSALFRCARVRWHRRSRGCHRRVREYALTPLRESTLVAAVSPPVCQKCCSPTRHKVKQIGTSCDREAATENVPSVPPRRTVHLGQREDSVVRGTDRGNSLPQGRCLKFGEHRICRGRTRRPACEASAASRVSPMPGCDECSTLAP